MAQAVRSPLCPDDFCPATLPAEPPSSLALDALRKPGTELWLIRTPADFRPASLNGCKVPLVGFQTLKSHRNETGIRQRYHVLSNTSRSSPETLLAPSSSADGQLAPAPALQGALSIIEVPRSKSSGRSLHAIPTSPPPQIPPGLRPRFQAFGGWQPVLGPPAQTVAGEAGEVKSSRKRKKPEVVSLNPSPQEILNGVGELNSAPGQGMPEPVEQVPVKTEEEATAPSPGKKKKKKSELAGEVPEPAGEVPEPDGGAMELQQEAVLSPTKAKKSKKRRELEGEVPEPGERRSESEVQINLQEEKALSSSRKKQEAGEEMLVPERAVGLEKKQAEISESLGEAKPPHSKKKKKEKKRKPEEGDGAAPEPPKEMESLAGVPESGTPSLGQGVEEKKRKKKRRHLGEGGPAEA
ncbi:DNA-directed RNA polymerase I subunit RPA34 [Phascolarctos cinereus]|uniref:DNA-directed RNA polymerase I subunit RPA34 n=1 Tax=Phascolarctos cinereus TaxID=38626 RepID=A0A6P5JNC4_PHACI|nr:DNA-directed RNA polymerase I subunit RPA34 [Phascolarctos cinereus]